MEIKSFAFHPSDIEIHVGDKIKFVNRDDVEHSAVADDGSFDTGMLGKDEEKTVTFDKAGTFTYYCNPHTGMTGKIVVKES
ncbi:plastocyanin/azurin family copper-binding protein [Cohnella candidum]|uniref:plastocyanin/azurin family copper-binding protein n=1 Tax=Cohnella candidum TaxID=2674991 RepID=UPI0013DDD276|nr:plastocyanin/azurin family copper-binding protein [Cohnella candidum]